MSLNAWDPRPRQSKGDVGPDNIFHSVGLALTLWETIETEISTAYVGIIPDEDYPTSKYFRLASFEGRHGLIKAAVEKNVRGKDCASFGLFADKVLLYSPRRHEIAHGRAYNCGDDGFILGPTNVLSRNFPGGISTYQYGSAEILYFCQEFARIGEIAKKFSIALARHS